MSAINALLFDTLASRADRAVALLKARSPHQLALELEELDRHCAAMRLLLEQASTQLSAVNVYTPPRSDIELATARLARRIDGLLCCQLASPPNHHEASAP